MQALFRTTFLTATVLALWAGSAADLAARSLYRVKNASQTAFKLKLAEDAVCKRKIKILKKQPTFAERSIPVDLSVTDPAKAVVFEPGTILEFVKDDDSGKDFQVQFDLEPECDTAKAGAVGELYFSFKGDQGGVAEVTLTPVFYPLGGNPPEWGVMPPEEYGGHDLEIQAAKALKPAGCCTIL